MTFRATLGAAFAAATLFGGMAVAPAGAADAPPKSAAPSASCVRGRDLMTAEERDAHRAKVQAAKTPEEQAKLRAAMHAEMAKRAAAKNMPLCEKGAGPGAGAGMGPGPGPGAGPGPAAGKPRPGGPPSTR